MVGQQAKMLACLESVEHAIVGVKVEVSELGGKIDRLFSISSGHYRDLEARLSAVEARLKIRRAK